MPDDVSDMSAEVLAAMSPESLRALVKELTAQNQQLRRMRALFQLMPCAMTLQDQDGVLLDCSDSFCEATGYARADVLGRDALDLNLWVDPQQRQTMRETVRREGRVDGLEFQLRCRSGQIRTFQISVRRLLVETETIVLSVASDISVRKSMEVALEESARRYHAYMDQAADAIFVHDFSGRFTAVNQRACDSLGYSREELLGMQVADVETEFDLARAQAAWSRIVPGEAFSLNGRQRRKDGTIFPVEVRLGVFTVAGQSRFMGLARDVSERERITAELSNAKTQLQTTLDAIPDLLFEVGEDGRMYEYHAHRADLLAAPPEVFLGKTIAEVLPTAASAICMAAIREASAKGWSTGAVYSLALPQGETWFELSVAAMPEGSASGRRFILLTRDITARRKAEAGRQVSEGQLQTFIAHSPVALAMFDRQMRYLHASAQWIKDYQLDGQTLIGQSHYDIFPEISEQWKAVHHRGLTGEVVRIEEDRFARVDGSVQWLRWEVRPWSDATGAVGGIVIYSEDITARRRAAEELSASEASFRSVIDASPVPMALNDEQHNITFLNPAFSQTFGYVRADIPTLAEWWIRAYPDPVYRKWVADSWVERMRLANEAGTAFTPMELTIRAKDGTDVVVMASASPLTNKPAGLHLVALYDITERKKAEQAHLNLEMQLLQAQKMEAIGTLAGGIAHDFNNILGIVSGNAELLGCEATLTPKQRRWQANIVAASFRARDLVRQILSFSRKRDPLREIVLFDAVIAEGLEFLRASIPASTSMTATYAAGDSRVRVDVTQIHQVVMNLITNAWQALPGQLGHIAVRTSMVDASGQVIAKGAPLPASRYVQLDVSDNGSGIPPELVERIFEPFFTTKDPGKGTGLGLAVVHGVVRRHDGTIVVQPNEGGGTTFRLLLPVVMDAVTQPEPSSQPPVGGGIHLLLVDDEPALTELASEMLIDLGYQVTTCGSARAALAKLRGKDPGFDVVVTDLAMPDMTGLQLAVAVHALHPDLPIVLATGFIDSASQNELAELNFVGVVMKPWTAMSLAQVVHAAMQKRPGRTP